MECLGPAVVSLCIFVTFFSFLNKNRGVLGSEKEQDTSIFLGGKVKCECLGS